MSLIKVLLLIAFWLAAAPASAGDWPQILGPARNGKAQNEKIAGRVPSGGPPVLWQHKVGSGYAGPAIVGPRLIVFHRVGERAVCEALDARTGKPLWKKDFPTAYASSIAPDNGPRCVPLVHDKAVYLFGADGDLHCLALESGNIRWSRELYKDFDASEGYFGAGSSPIVDGDKLLVNVGGRGAGIVAVSLDSGKTIWKATDAAASYSSPVAASIAGKRHVIFVTRLETISVDPATGNPLFRFPFGMRGPTVNGANPVVVGDHLFLTASYGIGSEWRRLSSGESERVWESDDLISSQYTTPIQHQGILYGTDGRQDAGVARLRAIDPEAKRVLWTEEGFGTATLILADGKLLIMKTDGTLVLVRPSPKAYAQLGSAKLFDDTVQALPALAGGRFYARDTQYLRAFDLGK